MTDAEAAATAAFNPRLESMFEKLAAKEGVHFKHQTRDEPDLTTHEKIEIARDIYLKSPGQFLARFHSYLDESDSDCFMNSCNDYEVRFYLGEISARNVGQTMKNRRYRAMERLMDEGQYFSLEAMRKRDPLLFEDLVGRYASEEERSNMTKPQYDTFSGFLLSSIDRGVDAAHLRLQKQLESNQFEENDDDEEEEEEEEDDYKCVQVPEQQKALLRSEFLTIMQDRFLRGEDRDFDYDSLNADLTLDDHKEKDLDCEERYFAGEDSESMHSLSTASSQNFIHRIDMKDAPNNVDGSEKEIENGTSIEKVDVCYMDLSEVVQVSKDEVEEASGDNEKT